MDYLFILHCGASVAPEFDWVYIKYNIALRLVPRAPRFLLTVVRFYKEETANDPDFAKKVRMGWWVCCN